MPFEDRSTFLTNMGTALDKIQADIEKVVSEAHAANRRDIGKLLISQFSADVKLEVNLVGCGTLAYPEAMILCEKAQKEFDAFCAIQVVSIEQLFGGNI